jgi:hypothetical protein
MKQFIIKATGYLLLIALLSGAIISLFIWQKPEYFLGAPLDYFYCKYQYDQINKKTNFTNIVIGDSRGNASINPKVMGEKWVNLSIPGSDFFEGYITLKRYLQKNKIDTLVMVYGLNYMGESSRFFNSRTIPFQFISYSELNNLEQVEKKYNYQFHGTVVSTPQKLKSDQFDRKLKLLHFPFSYRETFIDGLNSYYFPQHDINVDKKKILNELSENLGCMHFGEADSNNTDGINGDYAFSARPITQHYFNLIMDLATEHKIATWLFVAPMNQASFNTYNKSKYEASVNQFLERLQNKYPQLCIIQPANLPNTMFGDAWHVNKNGTARFTEITRRNLNYSNQ